MQVERFTIKFILPLLIVAVFISINSSALVINQWMDKTVAPRLLVIEKTAQGLELGLLGYDIRLPKDRVDRIYIDAQKVYNSARELTSYAEIFYKEAVDYWNRLRAEFFSLKMARKVLYYT